MRNYCDEHARWYSNECFNCGLRVRTCDHSQAVPLVEVTCNGDQIAGWLCADCHTELPTNWGEGALDS